MRSATKRHVKRGERFLRERVSPVSKPDLEDPQIGTEPEIRTARIEYGKAVELGRLSIGALLLVSTSDRHFLIRKAGPSRLLILGDIEQWSEPAGATVCGCPPDSSVIQRGMWLEFQRPGSPPDRTSAIRHVWLLEDGPSPDPGAEPVDRVTGGDAEEPRPVRTGYHCWPLDLRPP